MNFHVCATGLKGAVYLEHLLHLGLRPSRVWSYRQPDDVSCGFSQIQNICSTSSIELIEDRYPALTQQTPSFLVGWQYILPGTNENTIIFHDSLLPRYRGFAPTATALIKGEPEVGVTAFFARGSMDTGPIIASAAWSVAYPMRIADALHRQSRLMAELTGEIVGIYQSGGTPPCRDQDDAMATYSIWRDAADYYIDWNQTAACIRRMIDAVSYPYAGARFLMEGETFIVDQAAEVRDMLFVIRQPGKIWALEDGRPLVVCKEGILRLDRVLREDGSEFLFRRLRSRLG